LAVVHDRSTAIGPGAIGAAANRRRAEMAGPMTLVISFLERLVGSAGSADAIQKIVNRIRAPIGPAALDRGWVE